MRGPESAARPPRWTRALIECALPCDPMRDAILGDLNEEFVRDVADMDVRRASVLHARRAAGIATRALIDAAFCRNWVSSTAATGHEPVAERAHEAEAAMAAPRSASGSSRGLAGDAGFVVVALIVVIAGVVVNTMLFSAAEARTVRASSAAGIGGVVVLVASVLIAASVMCIGPRWRRKRLRGG